MYTKVQVEYYYIFDVVSYCNNKVPGTVDKRKRYFNTNYRCVIERYALSMAINDLFDIHQVQHL